MSYDSEPEDERRLPWDIARRCHVCQYCRLQGKPFSEIPRARVTGVRKAGTVGWCRVMLCAGCIDWARGAGYEVWVVGGGCSGSLTDIELLRAARSGGVAAHAAMAELRRRSDSDLGLIEAEAG